MTSTAVRQSGPATRAAGGRPPGAAMWAQSAEASAHVAFRSTLHLDRPTAVTIQVQAAGEFRLWIDGTTVAAGPLRYARTHPESHACRSMLAAGDHALAIHATGCPDLSGCWSAFVWVAVHIDGEPVDLDWQARRLSYRPEGRISPQLGYLEWQDRPTPRSWLVEPPGPDWREPQVLEEISGHFAGLTPAADLAWRLPSWPLIAPAEIGRGLYRDILTGPQTDPLTRFLLADTSPGSGDDVDGLWIRYDLGHTRIGTLEFTAAASQPAEITLAYADRLDHQGHLLPITPLAAGPSRLLQRFQLAAGSSRVEPLGAIGGRYLELRVRSRGSVTVKDTHYRDRDYLGDPVGQFECADSLLNRIWQVGLTTTRACAEDILVDSPASRREDLTALAGVGIELLSAGWGDLRLARQTLMHCAANARGDGLVADGGPEHIAYRGGSAAQWLTACVRYAQHAGDLRLLHELAEPAAANAAALLAGIAEDGTTSLPESFIDWGYPRPSGPDLALLCHVYRGMQSWMTWQELINTDIDPLWRRGCHNLHRLVTAALAAGGPTYWSAALAVHAGLQGAAAAAPLIADHLAQGFPFDPEAERLRDPSYVDPCAITPYFTTFSIPVLLAVGQTDAVFDLWRRGWGWMLAQDARTWWEVFDDRWGRCHYWSAAPTWQLSRYLLGLRPRLSVDRPALDLAVHPGSLDSARGVIPLAGEQIAVSWLRRRDRISYTLKTPRTLTLGGHHGAEEITPGTHRFDLTTTDGWAFRP